MDNIVHVIVVALDLSNSGIVSSNSARGMNRRVCPHLSALCCPM